MQKRNWIHKLIFLPIVFALVIQPVLARTKKTGGKSKKSHYTYEKGKYTKSGKYRKGHVRTRPDAEKDNNRKQTTGK